MGAMFSCCFVSGSFNLFITAQLSILSSSVSKFLFFESFMYLEFVASIFLFPKSFGIWLEGKVEWDIVIYSFLWMKPPRSLFGKVYIATQFFWFDMMDVTT
jgi:hypothetical protein